MWPAICNHKHPCWTSASCEVSNLDYDDYVGLGVPGGKDVRVMPGYGWKHFKDMHRSYVYIYIYIYLYMKRGSTKTLWVFLEVWGFEHRFSWQRLNSIIFWKLWEPFSIWLSFSMEWLTNHLENKIWWIYIPVLRCEMDTHKATKYIQILKMVVWKCLETVTSLTFWVSWVIFRYPCQIFRCSSVDLCVFWVMSISTSPWFAWFWVTFWDEETCLQKSKAFMDPSWPTLHPGKLTWSPKMEVWKMMFRFHVDFQGCNSCWIKAWCIE